MLQRGDAPRLARNGFKRIVADLQMKIEQGDLPNGRYLPTERELQEEFGASRSTIRRALAMLIDTGYAQNVPSKGVIASRALKTPKTRNIALIDGSSYVLKVLLVRISEALRASGYLLVHLGGNNESSLEDALLYAAEHEFAGALVWPFRGFPDPEIVANVARQVPLVVLDHRLKGVTTDFVTFDYLEAGALATTQLARQGCRRIGITGMMDMLEINHDKFSGYMRAMFDAGLQPNARDYLFSFTSGMGLSDTRGLEARLREPDRPDGLVILQDSLVPDTIEAVIRVGLRIPEDVKIVVIGDDLDVTIGDRGLTAVAQDWEIFATQALELLEARLQDPDAPPQTRTAPHRLVVRGLCGAPREQWTPDPERYTGFSGQVPFPRSRYQFTP